MVYPWRATLVAMGAEQIERIVTEASASTRSHVENAAGALIHALGETLDVSRVYVFRFQAKGDEVRVSQIKEWVADGIAPEIDNPAMQDATMESMGLGRWGEILLNGGIISGPVRDLPADERPFLEEQAIQSIIVVPIEYQEKVWGCVGFDDCNQVRQFTAQEAFALRRAATLLAEVIELADQHAFE